MCRGLKQVLSRQLNIGVVVTDSQGWRSIGTTVWGFTKQLDDSHSTVDKGKRKRTDGHSDV